MYAPDEGLPSASTASVDLRDVHSTILEACDVDVPVDGRDLRRDVADGESLVEYHGLSDRDDRSLRERGVDRVDRLNQELLGFVTGEYYGYQTFDGWNDRGPPPVDDPRGRLEELASKRRTRTVDDETYELPEEVEARLADLGYG
ncbi:hypothetical protein BRC81_05210 [Halobacteriales archaeon QS_1_68_20]|nr:MAG: hypothetical protein BRC81_05210 [Halobacteriales archaeon QS_1_68_20]